jgi:hypothetical protein
LMQGSESLITDPLRIQEAQKHLDTSPTDPDPQRWHKWQLFLFQRIHILLNLSYQFYYRIPL